MTTWFLFRLALDFLAIGLLIVAFLYDWLGNVAHEIAGTVMLALLIAHNVFNRRWWGRLPRTLNGPSGQSSKAVNVCFLLTMVLLFATSVVISQAVFSFLPLKSSFSYRRVHTLVAYLGLMFAGIHVGLHWSMIMDIVRDRLGIAASSRLRKILVRLAAGIIGVVGIQSIFALDLASKLSMQVPMGFAAFEMPTPILLLHHLSIIGVFACAGHYFSNPLTAKERRQESE